MTFYFTNGSRIICAGLSDEERLKSIVGITSTWLEEANELTLREYLQVNLRMRGMYGTHFQNVLTFNPISRTSWLYKYFFEKEQAATTIHKSTYKDNRFIDDGYEETLKGLAGQDETFYEIYAKGEWGTLTGLIFQNYQWIADWKEPFPGTIYGLDFGYNSETALIEVGLHDEAFYLREVVYEKKLHGSALVDRLRDIKFSKDAIVYADAEDPARIAELYQAGYRVFPCKKGGGSVKAGLDFMKRRQIKISDTSPNILSEIESYKYVEDKKSGEIVDEPVKWHDHAMDAVRYAIFTHYADRRETYVVSS
jgi:phage terminase large subunit